MSIVISKEEFYKLASAQIVLDVLMSSIKKLNESNEEKTSDDKSEQLTNEITQTKLTPFLEKILKNVNNLNGVESEVNNRKFFNIKRWLKPLAQEEAMQILGFSEPFDQIRFGPFTGNLTLIKWFNQLNKHFNLNGRASIFYKPVGTCKTVGLGGKVAKEKLQTYLHLEDKAFIYHCYNHYCCPIGYEKEPSDHTKIYHGEVDQTFVDWVFLADTSRKYASIHCVKWEDMDKDLNTKSPEFVNIRQVEKGVQTRQRTSLNNNESTKVVKKGEKNLHCLILFEKTEENLSFECASDLVNSLNNELDESDGNESEQDN